MTNMVAENLEAVPQMATIPGLSQMTSEQFGIATSEDSTLQGQVDTLTRLMRLVFVHIARQQELTQNLIDGISTEQESIQAGNVGAGTGTSASVVGDSVSTTTAEMLGSGARAEIMV